MMKKIYILIIIFGYYSSLNMEYLTKRNKFKDKVVFDNLPIKSNSRNQIIETDFDKEILPIFLEEIKKIENGTSHLLR